MDTQKLSRLENFTSEYIFYIETTDSAHGSLHGHNP